jgi:hypothetical protein
VTPKRAQEIIKRRLGPLAVLAKSAGRYSVILMNDKRYGSGFTITDLCPTPSLAVSQAIKFAVEEHMGTWRGLTPSACSQDAPAPLLPRTSG